MDSARAPLSVVCWYWGARYSEAHVHRLAAAVHRHLHVPFRFYCIADRPLPGIEVIPMWDPRPRPDVNFRRLQMFSEEVAGLLGPRILQLDIDQVILDDLTPLITAEPVRIYRSPSIGRAGVAYNPSMLLFDAPCRQLERLWPAFLRDPNRLVKQAQADGWRGTDQAVLSMWLHGQEGVATFEPSDGIYSMRDHFLGWVPSSRRAKFRAPPPGTRVVNFYGRMSVEDFTHIPWVAEAWRD